MTHIKRACLQCIGADVSMTSWVARRAGGGSGWVGGRLGGGGLGLIMAINQLSNVCPLINELMS